MLLQYRFNDHPQEEIGEDDADDDDDEPRCNVGMENNEMTSASGSG